MIAVFSAYREPPGEWESRKERARVVSHNTNGGEPFLPIGEHTRHEAELIVDECHRRGEADLWVVTSASHSYRAALTVLKVLIDRGLERQVRLYVVQSTDAVEMEKIERYRALGHVASEADFEAYSHWWTPCAT